MNVQISANVSFSYKNLMITCRKREDHRHKLTEKPSVDGQRKGTNQMYANGPLNTPEYTPEITSNPWISHRHVSLQRGLRGIYVFYII